MKESVAILKTLAEGFDPRTGEEFDGQGAWSDPKVIRALFRGAEALESQDRRRASRIDNLLPPAAGQPWTAEEDDRLKNEYRTVTETRALADLHSRTQGAIAARLVRLGLVEPPVRPASPGA